MFAAVKRIRRGINRTCEEGVGLRSLHGVEAGGVIIDIVGLEALQRTVIWNLDSRIVSSQREFGNQHACRSSAARILWSESDRLVAGRARTLSKGIIFVDGEYE